MLFILLLVNTFCTFFTVQGRAAQNGNVSSLNSNMRLVAFEKIELYEILSRFLESFSFSFLAQCTQDNASVRTSTNTLLYEC